MLKWLIPFIQTSLGDPDKKTENIEIQLIDVNFKKRKGTHRWVLVTTIVSDDGLLDVGTRHKDYHLWSALKAHCIYIKNKYDLDITHTVETSYYYYVILPRLLKNKDWKMHFKSQSKKGRRYLLSKVLTSELINRKND